jgi:2-phosphosulfolactate phosphatase
VRVRVDLVAAAGAQPSEYLPGWPLEARRQTAVVIDVLRATTTLTVAFTHGARRVIPVASPAEALAQQAREPDVLLCGERGGRRIPDFHLGNSPAEYSFAAVSGRTLVFASTNGSLAMLAAARCGERLLGAFINASAVAAALAGREFVRILCAGREKRFAVEDVACAGWLCAALASRGARIEGGAARLARALAPRDSDGVRACLQGSASGRALRELGGVFARDVEFCAELDHVDRAFSF